jgi:hypothetical protein
MTSTIAAALSFVVALAGLVYLHQRDLHRQRQARRRYSHQLIQAQLDRARTYDLRRDLDDEYRRLRENAGDTPYDWEKDALAAALDLVTREEVTT